MAGQSTPPLAAMHTTVQQLLTGATRYLLVEPTPAHLRSAVVAHRQLGSTLGGRILVTAATWRSVQGAFVTALTAADLVETDRLAVRTTEDTDGLTVAVVDDQVFALATVDDRPIVLGTVDDSTASDVRSVVERRWEDGETVETAVPGIGSLTASLGNAVDADVAADFESLFTALGDPSQRERLDAATTLLLSGARHGALLYDLAQWAEESGFTTRSALSQSKQPLVDAGLLTIERIPSGVGRPRQRLHLSDDRLLETEPAAWPALVSSTLP